MKGSMKQQEEKSAAEQEQTNPISADNTAQETQDMRRLHATASDPAQDSISQEDDNADDQSDQTQRNAARSGRKSRDNFGSYKGY